MKRLDWIDIAKGIGILLVVLGHSRLNTGFAARWISSFHMPLFFILAGLCYDEMRYPSYLSYIKRKVTALAYPYFTLSFVVIAMFSVLYFGDNPAFGAKTLFLDGTLKGSTFGAFWFVTSLFCVEVLYAGFSRVVSSPIARIIVMLLVSLAAAYFIESRWPYFIDTTLVAMFFYAFGHILRLLLPMIANFRMNVFYRFGLAGGGHVLLLLFAYHYKADFVSHNLGNPVMFLFCAILGSAFVMLISLYISIMKPTFLDCCKTSLIFVGKNTIILLAMHNALGVCRQSWVGKIPYMNGMTSVLVELLLLGTLLWLLSGPCRFIIDFKVMKQLIMRIKKGK